MTADKSSSAASAGRPARRGAMLRGAVLALTASTMLGGCAGGLDKLDGVFRRDRGDLSARPATARADINSSGKLGDIDIPVIETPSLEEIVQRTPVGKKEDTPEKEGDKLRAPAMRDAALSYGARAGLAWTSRGINEQLRSRAPDLTKTYDFNRILIKTPSQATIMPPVISEANEAYETSDAGKTLRVADKVYAIVETARFVPVAPLWQSYLVRSYTAPEAPPDTLLPKSDGERDAWRRWLTEGWEIGGKQAREIFEADLRRLERDFVGMVRYKALLEEGKVSAPIVAEGNLGVTGTGQDMRVNDRALRITKDPSLQTSQKGWSATPSPTGEVRAAQDLPTRQSDPGDNTRARTGKGWSRY